MNGKNMIDADKLRKHLEEQKADLLRQRELPTKTVREKIETDGYVKCIDNLLFIIPQ